MAGLNVLVVEDCSDTAASLALLLGVNGHQARVAGDGPTALELAWQDRPDVVLLDIGLPGMSGHDLARQLRESLLDKPPLIVALTGYSQDSDRRRSQEAGIDLHLVKPVEPLALTSLLSRFARVLA